jgi:ketosteroid isomerase-like protein
VDVAKSGSTDWKTEITASEAESARAFLARDIARLEQLWSDDLLINSPLNKVSPKRQILEMLQKGVIAHHALEQRPEIMRRDGDLVVVMGFDFVQDTPESPVLRRRITNVWRQENGAWRLYIRQATLAPE